MKGGGGNDRLINSKSLTSRAGRGDILPEVDPDVPARSRKRNDDTEEQRGGQQPHLRAETPRKVQKLIIF